MKRNQQKVKNILTKRESQVAARVREELSTKQIAAELHIRPSTVESQKKSIREKIGVLTSIGIALYAERNNLCRLLVILLSYLQTGVVETVLG